MIWVAPLVVVTFALAWLEPRSGVVSVGVVWRGGIERGWVGRHCRWGGGCQTGEHLMLLTAHPPTTPTQCVGPPLVVVCLYSIWKTIFFEKQTNKLHNHLFSLKKTFFRWYNHICVWTGEGLLPKQAGAWMQKKQLSVMSDWLNTTTNWKPDSKHMLCRRRKGRARVREQWNTTIVYIYINEAINGNG
jgi:hypothetical protein